MAPAKPTRQRRARSCARGSAQASQQGRCRFVRYEVEPDGKVIISGKPEPKNETDRELDEFNARHG